MLPRTKTFLMIAALCFGLAVLFYSTYITHALGIDYIAAAEVRSATLLVETTPYPLSFEEQTTLVHLLNGATPLDPEEDVTKGAKPAFTKIVLYGFKDTPVEINPILYLGDSLVFNCIEWKEGVLLKDNSHGELKKFLSDAYQKLLEQERPQPQ